MFGVRTGEPGTRVDLTEELRRVEGALAIAPGPLSAAAAGTLIATGLEQAPSAGFAAACRPRALATLPRGRADARPAGGGRGAHRRERRRGSRFAAAGVAGSIQGRLARLGEAKVAVARAVAVLEPNATPERLATLARLERRLRPRRRRG